MGSQITRSNRSVAFAPSLYCTCTCLLRLVSQDDVTCSSMHEVYNRTSLHIETWTYGRVHLRDNHDLTTVKDAQMTRLTKFVRNLLHNWQSLHGHAFDWRMF